MNFEPEWRARVNITTTPPPLWRCLEEISNDLRPPKLAHNALGPATWWERGQNKINSHTQLLWLITEIFSRNQFFIKARARQRRLHGR